MRTQGDDGDIGIGYDIRVGVGFYSAKYKILALKSITSCWIEDKLTFISNDIYLPTFPGNT